jgi:hypothetical protein
MTDKKHCPFVEGCPMFKLFHNYAKDVYKEVYCLGNYQSTCLRYRKRAAGETVPENLMPHGGTLSSPSQL